MSVMIISDAHMSAVLRYAFAKTWNDSIDRESTVRIVQDAADELARVNDQAYAHRYPDQPVDEFQAPVIDWKAPLVSHIQFLKLLMCLEYQMDGLPGFHDTDAAQFIRNHRGTAIGKLDGYADAKWSID